MNNKYQYPPIRLAWAGSILSALLLFGGNPVYADRYVAPTNTASASPYNTWGIAATNIQHAVDAAADGETVWLTNGIYFCQGVTNLIHSYFYSQWGSASIVTNTAMVVITNAINLKSWSGNYTNTVINGNFPNWTTMVVLVVNTNVVLAGLTITNGYDDSPYINGAQAGAGGVYFKGALMTNCLITGNMKSNSWTGTGAGVLLANGIVTHCTIAGNRNDLDKGQAFSFNDNAGSGPGPTFISNCVFAVNGKTWGTQSDAAAVGSWRDTSRPGIVTKSLIANNNGHGFEVVGGGLTLSDCVVISNGGSGVRSYAAYSLFTVKNCLFTRNYYNGFQATCRTGYPLKFENCTSVSNGRSGYPYGIQVTDEAGYSGAVTNSTVANCIIYDNYYVAGSQLNWYDNQGTSMIYTNCCTTPMPTNQTHLSQGTGNITSAPMFVSPPGNYRLSSQSPCINTGAYRSWMDGAFDLEGNKRIFEGVVDRGAYEFQHKGTMFRIQ